MTINVSIALIAYNSEKTILQTLESINEQTYDHNHIELIIADDCSQDNTLKLARDWADNVASKKLAIKIIEGNSNEGVVKNCNKAWKICSGEWIKTIAADDILHKDCVQDNVDFIRENKDALVVFSKMQIIGSEQVVPQSDNLIFNKIDHIYQSRILLFLNEVPAPTSFMSNILLERLNYADEEVRNIEDFYLWLKIVKNNIPLYFLDKVTVYYRVGSGVSSSNEENLINIKYLKYKYSCLGKGIGILTPLEKIIYIYEQKRDYFSKVAVSKIFSNRKNKLSLFMIKLSNILSIGIFYKIARFLRKAT